MTGTVPSFCNRARSRIRRSDLLSGLDMASRRDGYFFLPRARQRMIPRCAGHRPYLINNQPLGLERRVHAHYVDSSSPLVGCSGLVSPYDATALLQSRRPTVNQRFVPRVELFFQRLAVDE